jgi:Zn-finger nucleic acid-binding protein
MKCPRCEAVVLEEQVRDAITIDVCRECRGIWLDRGELERLIARAATETSSGRSGRPFDDDDDDDDRRRDEWRGREDENPGRGRGAPEARGRKRSWLESLTDAFD